MNYSKDSHPLIRSLIDPVITLEFSLDVWRELAKTGDTSRDLIFKNKSLPALPAVFNACALCLYGRLTVRETVEEYPCWHCNQLVHWTPIARRSCCLNGGFFEYWRFARTKTARKKWAKKIVRLFEESLDDYLKKELGG